jgi:transcriptional regulator with XRE-family HTH domain
MSYLMDKLAEFIRQTMQAKGIKSTREVARLSGGNISHATVANILSRNVADIDVTTFLALADALGVKPSEMARTILDDHLPPWMESKEFKGSDFYGLYLDYMELQKDRQEETNVMVTALKEFIEKRRAS